MNEQHRPNRRKTQLSIDLLNEFTPSQISGLINAAKSLKPGDNPGTIKREIELPC